MVTPSARAGARQVPRSPLVMFPAEEFASRTSGPNGAMEEAGPPMARAYGIPSDAFDLKVNP